MASRTERDHPRATKIYDGQTVQGANAGFVVHMIQGIDAPNLATAKKIAALLKADNDNAAGALATGEYGWDGPLSHGQSFESVVTQKPGYWVIACFMDTQDGREHTTLGMERSSRSSSRPSTWRGGRAAMSRCVRRTAR